MHCDAVTREISAPSGRLARASLAAHLAACPACAAFASASERLDRAWAATAPPTPPADAFDAAWARVPAAKPAPDLRLAPWWVRACPDISQRQALRGAAYLQAAIVLVALSLGLVHYSRRVPGTLVTNRPPLVATQVDIAEGQIVLIPLDGRPSVQVVELVPEASSPNALAPDFDVLNEFEAMASL